MDIKKLQRAIVDGLEDVKAQEIVVFNTEHLSALFERVIIASGTSNRQTKALASSVRETVKKRGMQVMRTEGEDNGEWIIVDCGAAVVHVMQPAIRQYYHLEEIWGGKPVKVKVGTGETRLVKASEPMDDDEDEVSAKPAKKSAAKKSTAAAAPASKKVPSRATGTKTAAAKTSASKPAAKSAGAKPVTGKLSPAKAAATKTAGTKTAATKTATKTAPTKSAASKTAAAKRPAAKRIAAATPVQTVKVGQKKPAAKKASASTAKPAAKPAAKTAAKPVARTGTARPAAKKTTVTTGTKSKR